MDGKIYEEVIFDEQWSSTYDKMKEQGNEVMKGFFLPIQIKTMIEAGLWTTYQYNGRVDKNEDKRICNYLDELIAHGSGFDDLYVEYVPDLTMNKNPSYYYSERDDYEEFIVIFFIRHNITIDDSNKVIFKHPLRFDECKDYHDLMRCFPVNWDGLCEIMNRCYDYDFRRYRDMMDSDDQKYLMHNCKNSSFMVYWYYTDLWNKKNSKGKRDREVRMIEVLNQHSCRPMYKDDVSKYLDKRIE